MIALFFGTYNSSHAANVLLAGDLERAGIELCRCHEPLWEETRDKHDSYFAPLALLRLGLRWLRAAWRLRSCARRYAPAVDLLVTGFNGQLDVLLARCLGRRKPILFAPLVSITETLVDDRGTYAAGSLLARLFTVLDRICLRAADRVLIDTAAHRQYLTERLGAAPERVVVQYLGAEDAFVPAEPPESIPGAPLRVLFYCTYIALHGARVVAEAACALRADEGIELSMIGTGPERAACEKRLCGFKHVRIEDWIPYAELPARIAAADVVLGIFGRSVKARMVIPNKVYQAAQVGRAIVTADTPAIREVFRPGESIWVVAPESAALVEALRRLAADPELRARLGRAAREDVLHAAGPAARAARLAAVAAELSAAPRSHAV